MKTMRTGLLLLAFALLGAGCAVSPTPGHSGDCVYGANNNCTNAGAAGGGR